jgi:hypothetical protein
MSGAEGNIVVRLERNRGDQWLMVFHGEHVRIQVSTPLFAGLCDAQMPLAVLDIAMDDVPKKRRLVVA